MAGAGPIAGDGRHAQSWMTRGGGIERDGAGGIERDGAGANERDGAGANERDRAGATECRPAAHRR
jgi:hypothetical protein